MNNFDQQTILLYSMYSIIYNIYVYNSEIGFMALQYKLQIKKK